MLTPVVQRWREQRATYRPAREAFNPRACEVAPIPEATAKAFVTGHHYSGTYPAARRRYGLYEGGALVGVAVYSQPVNDRALRPFTRESAVEFGRLVLLDRVLANAETWFIARCHALLRVDGFGAVVSFSDPVARTDRGGAVVFPGHIGTIYQASNAVYTGRSLPGVVRLMPDGTVFSPRAAAKVRSRDQGWQYAVGQLVAAGATAPGDTSEDALRVWLREAIATATRPLRHGGNHRYVFSLERAARKALPATLPYPKVDPRPADPG